MTIDPGELAALDDSLAPWESGELMRRARALEEGLRAGRHEGDDDAELRAAIGETRAALTSARAHLQQRFDEVTRNVGELTAMLDRREAELDRSGDEALGSLTDLQGAAGNVADDLGPATQPLMDRLHGALPEGAGQVEQGVARRSASLIERIEHEWLPAVHTAVHQLDERLQAIESQLGDDAQEVTQGLHHDGEEGAERARTGADTQVAQLGSSARAGHEAIEATGHAAQATGTVLIEGQRAVATASRATQSGLVVALETLDELLRLMQNLR